MHAGRCSSTDFCGAARLGTSGGKPRKRHSILRQWLASRVDRGYSSADAGSFTERENASSGVTGQREERGGLFVDRMSYGSLCPTADLLPLTENAAKGSPVLSWKWTRAVAFTGGIHLTRSECLAITNELYLMSVGWQMDESSSPMSLAGEH